MLKHLSSLCFTFVLAATMMFSANVAQANTISEYTADMQQNSGFFSFYYDAATDKVYVEVPRQSPEFIFQSSLPRGIGSNDIGLDRGQLGSTRLAQFSVHGKRVLLTEKNTQYRAITENAAERESVAEAFAESVLWGFDVVATNEHSVLIDYTPFLYTDIHGIEDRLQRINEGNFSVNASRSVLWPDRMAAFPKNTELEAKVTFTGSGAGRYVRSVTPEPTAITVHLHHSFIQLPDDGYQPRAFHPNSGYYALGFQDYAAPLQESMNHRFISRHRLEKKDPGAALSEPVEPIIYYLDPGVPEPVRTALLDGARWWNEGFEAIGYKDAFIVKELPADADPMDVRYNIIQWIHRATRGWSYGYSIADPRTGEIIKGHVSLGSLRVRQDMLIAQGLLAPFAEGKDSSQLMADIEEMALNRIRQLSAHEIGHTIGIAHNFASNSQDRASVMDYPHPLIQVTDNGEISLNEAYSSGLGVWDKFTVAYGYSEFDSDEAEQAGLQALIAESYAQNMHFISDRDARAIHGGHPTAHLWNNGANATDELMRLTEVRAKVLASFGLDNIAEGRPLDELEPILAPMYLLHRYQIEAAVKLVAGVNYRYAVAGEANVEQQPLSADEQNRALTALLATLRTDFLALPEHIEPLLVPKAYGSQTSREDFASRAGFFADPVTMAEASANHTLTLLLNPQRLNRLNWQAQRDTDVPTPYNLSKALFNTTLNENALHHPVAQRVLYLASFQLVSTMLDSATAPEVRSQLAASLTELRSDLQQSSNRRARQAELQRSEHFRNHLARLITQALENGEWPEAFQPMPMPPGSPI